MVELKNLLLLGYRPKQSFLPSSIRTQYYLVILEAEELEGHILPLGESRSFLWSQ